MTNLKAWREGKVVEGELPSGLEIKFKRDVKLEAIFGSGDVPTPLLNMAAKANSGAVDDASAAKELPQIIKLADAIILDSWIEPEITENPTDTTVSLNEIDDVDKMAFFTYMTGNLEGLADAKSFRVVKRKNGHAARSGEGV